MQLPRIVAGSRSQDPRIAEFASGLPGPRFAISDATTGAIAVGGPNGAAIVSTNKETVTRIALPEHFVDVVLVGDEAVCVHPELGAWWIKAAPAA